MTGAGRLLPLALLVGLTGLVGGCGDDGRDQTEGGDPTGRLESSRDAALAGARPLLRGLADEVAGRVSTGVGQFQGCAERFPEGTRSIEYVVRARVDPGSAAPGSLLEGAGGALEQAGFADPVSSRGPGGAVTWTGSRGEVGASVTQSGGNPWLVVDLRGPCVEVDDGDEDGWLARGVDDLTDR